MKRFFNWILKYKYKIATAVGLAVLLNFLGDKFNIDLFTGITAVIVNALILFIYIISWVGIKNTWVRDDDKLNAIIFSAFNVGATILTIYLLFR